ncbi:hypothetical protein GOBAR_DD09860 [Gossypium barbadense]|nr:hypothetical protein GOBAR_DD09860 [Gossypium barbadense]
MEYKIDSTQHDDNNGHWSDRIIKSKKTTSLIASKKPIFFSSKVASQEATVVMVNDDGQIVTGVVKDDGQWVLEWRRDLEVLMLGIRIRNLGKGG